MSKPAASGGKAWSGGVKSTFFAYRASKNQGALLRDDPPGQSQDPAGRLACWSGQTV